MSFSFLYYSPSYLEFEDSSTIVFPLDIYNDSAY